MIAVKKNEVFVSLSASQWKGKFNLYCVQHSTVFEEQVAMVVVVVAMKEVLAALCNLIISVGVFSWQWKGDFRVFDVFVLLKW